MAKFLEIKQLLGNIFAVGTDIDESCDIIISRSGHGEDDSDIVLSSSALKEKFDNLQNYKRNGLELYTADFREVALQTLGSAYYRSIGTTDDLKDEVNEITYSVGAASPEYLMHILNAMLENESPDKRRSLIDLRHRSRIVLRHYAEEDKFMDPFKLLGEVLKIYTLKITSVKQHGLGFLRERAISYEFYFMYKRGIAVTEYSDVQDLYTIGNSVLRYTREEMDMPPQRVYNAEVIDYYTMAMESRDPFTMYISFYHVIEHYFDAVYRKKLTDEIRGKITSPDFSYKSEKKLYELAKFIKKHMNSDLESGKGNEFDSLRYVLMEYVPIDELKIRISQLDSDAVLYYQENNVGFTSSKKTKVAWANSEGVYTNLATRIYETRNALVHSKSEQSANQYKPYKNKKDLILEIALIKAVAELVIINSSEIL